MDLKKSRTIFNPHQLSFLEEYYSDNPFPKTKERQQIADQLGIHLLHVKVWFQNKRVKEKRKQKKQALVRSKIFVPKPPSFWPNNIPFNSKITDVLKQSTETFPASSSASSCLLKSSSQSMTACPTTMASFSELPGFAYDQFPLPDQPSSLDVIASNSMFVGLQSSKESPANNYQTHLDIDMPQRGLAHRSSNGFHYGSDYLQHVDKSFHYCSDAYTFNSEDRHLANVPFGAMRHNSTSTSSVSMMPVNDSLNPVVLKLKTQSTCIESTNLAAIESPIHSRHTFTGDELPEIGSSHVDFLMDNSSAEFLTSQHSQKYYFSDNNHISHMMEQQVARHSEETQSYSDITQCLTAVEATLHAPMCP